MSTFMSTALSGVFSLLEFGASVPWLQVWGQSFPIALPIAFSLDMIFGNRLRLLSANLTEKAADAWPRQPVFGRRPSLAGLCALLGRR
ncbi:DUF2798 domain-containing protein [Arenibacterium halophilum]|uniref:DUF2798 domain-containing protein n=1 Tax=Arenibacterium halophilum TaxID=2583821 RepID=A0ABY2X5E1_9RHOB|nr:DUF2798 domain-containing protein [Arenibacterium halophilum]